MIIGIDGNEANIQKRVGVNVFAFELLWAFYRLLKKSQGKGPIIFRIYLKHMPLHDMPPESTGWEYRVLPGKGLWIITRLMPDLYLFSPKPNIFFTPSHYIPPFAPCPRVCAVMDLGYLKFSDQFKKYDFWQLKLWTAYSIYVSKYIVSISQASTKDIIANYRFASNKITTVPLAYDKKLFNLEVASKAIEKVKLKYSIVNDYILFLSTLKPSKNIEGLIDAWSKIESKFPKVVLVIAGKKGWLFDSIFKKVSSLNLSKRVIFTDFVDEVDKPALIKGAKVFVLPSFWEGFGLDVLNAQAVGVPVIVSRLASLPEVAGKAGIYIDPRDPSNIAVNIEKVLNMSKKQYNVLVSHGLAQAGKFSWDKTGKKIYALLRKH